MGSIGQARERLPREFIQRLQEVFPSPVVDKILAGMVKERFPTLRVNTLKAGVREVMEELSQAGVKVDRVLWYQDALVIKNKKEKDLEDLPLYQEGKIYLQSLSSMIPPLLLRPQPGEKVLDMAAAPGSKTTQMAAMMKNQGIILANEPNQIRFERLAFNLNRQGAEMVQTRLGDGAGVGRERPGFFDRVLLDAPCSGEGLFLADSAGTYRHWTTKGVSKMSSLQERLFSSAVEALRPGGIMVYSTCTLSPDENELVLDKVLRRFSGELEVLEPPLEIPGSLPGLTALKDVRLFPTINRTRRILPSATMEGFFVAVLKKVSR